ncbi:hypothetical protein EJB05_41448 [Eragrostis curvula]|uniref:TFIIS central domain-containing protein n=1 Tax=Eragrostis curvula TaxID=38414 RepID=A0A5J9T9N6_9POAL|nr:hypothetical protein EJB05_41448 [Eragrostis curvula]
MELSKQLPPAPAPGSTAAPRPSPSAASPSSQSASQVYPGNLGTPVPTSEYLIVPMGVQPVQVGASSRPSSRVSLRPPQQVLNAVQEGLPGISPSHPSPSSVGKKMAASAKVQMLNSGPSKSSVQKELLLSESVRAKFREALAVALGVDSDHLNVQQSAINASPIGSSGDNKHSDEMAVGASESSSKLNAERDSSSDIDAGASVSLNEPEPKRPKISDEVIGEKKCVIQNVQILAFRIEEELFRLFGEVSKKYKEKGRSLLFNLKDQSNPALREQVLSGEITPKFLCSMTTEELASKELSAWRLAKAEELEKKVVRPDREVDLRRLVRKTHKGEFHVEVEDSDGISVEVELGGDSLFYALKSVEDQPKSENAASFSRGDKGSDHTPQDEIDGKRNSNLQSNSEEGLANVKDVPMQECMADDLKDKENLSDIMSLDKLTEAHDSQLHYEDHSIETAEDAVTNKADITLKPEKYGITEDKTAIPESEFTFHTLSPNEKCGSKITSPKHEPFPSLDQAISKGDVLINASSEMATAEKLDTGSCGVSVPGGIIQSNTTPDAALAHSILWEGTIRFNLSSLTNVVAVFKSGEKPSTNDWRRSVEIKGSVRIHVFKEFLEQLPHSKSRAVTVTELHWKEGSRESGRQHLVQIIDSYIADERVGLVKPAQGVDLYLCPSHGKAAQILAEHLPKEHLGSLTVTGEASVIGVVVWRRPCASTSVPTKHDDFKRPSMSLSRNQRAVIASSVPMPSQHAKSPASHFIHSNEHPRLSDRSDAVHPDFGHGGVKHDDDLPEYGVVNVSNTSLNVATSHISSSRSQQHVSVVSPPPDLVNQIVRKYSNRCISAQPWDDIGDELGPQDQERQIVRRYGNRYASAQPWDDNSDDLGPQDQGRQMHVMPMQQPWNYQRVVHPDDARSEQLGRWGSPGMHAEEMMPMRDFFRRSCFAAEQEYRMRWHRGPRRFRD